ncbi:MAG TPA: lytic transglycosylase domain-containing protein [Leptolinea sp.]
MLNSIFDSAFQNAMVKILTGIMATPAVTGQPVSDSQGVASSASFSQVLSAKQTPAPVAVSGNKFADLINSTAKKYGVDPNLVNAIVKAESNYNPQAVSSCGAQGLMQLMPGTARSLGVANSLDPAQNIDGGVRFLQKLLTHYNGNVQFAVAAYNAGPGAVDKYNGIPPYTETQTYVTRVMGYLKSATPRSS